VNWFGGISPGDVVGVSAQGRAVERRFSVMRVGYTLHGCTGPAATSNSVQPLKPPSSLTPSWDGSVDGGMTSPETAITLKPGGSFLEMGAGTGRVALDVAAKGGRVTCVEGSEPMLERLREKAEVSGYDVVTHLDDMTSFAGSVALRARVAWLDGRTSGSQMASASSANASGSR